MKIKTRKVIDCFEFDKLVSETYGRTYCFQQQNGCQDRGNVFITVPVEDPEDYDNITVPEKVNCSEMGVSFKAWLERDPTKKLSNKDDQDDFCLGLWWDRNFYPHLDMIINDLHKKGLLDEGEYCIEIDW